ncbi:hypothetical protein VPH35_138773 [Triticum aestivum]
MCFFLSCDIYDHTTPLPSSSISRSPEYRIESPPHPRLRRRRRPPPSPLELASPLRPPPSALPARRPAGRLILSSSSPSSSWSAAAAAAWNPKALVDQSGDPGRRSKGAVWW